MKIKNEILHLLSLTNYIINWEQIYGYKLC